MTKSLVRVACCQIESIVGEREKNVDRAQNAIESAVQQGAQVIILPELANTGYSFADRQELGALAEPLDGPTVMQWRALADEHDVLIAGGYAERADDGKFYNSAILAGRDVFVNYRKVHLWNAEKELFAPGNEAPPVVSTLFGRIGLMVCYDLEFPEWVRSPALAGAELLCAPVNWPLYARPDVERPSEIFRVQANASVNRMAIAVADRVGEDRQTAWLGGSVIVDAEGFPLAMSDLGVAGSIFADIDMQASRSKMISERNNVHQDRRPELY